MRDVDEQHSGRAPGRRPSAPALVAALATRDDRYARVARLRGDVDRRVRTPVVDRLVARTHLPVIHGPARRAATRWGLLRASAAGVSWTPLWRAPAVALALLPLALVGVVLVAVLAAIVVADLALRTVPAPGRLVRRSLRDRHAHRLDLSR